MHTASLIAQSTVPVLVLTQALVGLSLGGFLVYVTQHAVRSVARAVRS